MQEETYKPVIYNRIQVSDKTYKPVIYNRQQVGGKRTCVLLLFYYAFKQLSIGFGYSDKTVRYLVTIHGENTILLG